MSARALAALDVLASLAEVASNNNYIKPHVHDGDEMIVVDGRHPVVERHAAPGSDAAGADGFVPNDIALNGTTSQLMILTGPNMGGKSTYLRQTALLSPDGAGRIVRSGARGARSPIVDRIFARVGASDNIARGQSTFMVEMQETANILHQATTRSLVVLDEIGRGTATFDGLSIAWAVAEHLATNNRARPKTLFATHYHELTDLADATPGVVNFHVAVREWKDDIVFLRKIVAGTLGPQLRHPGRAARRAAGAQSSRARVKFCRRSSATSSRVAAGRRSAARQTDPQRQLGLFQAPPDADDQLRERLERRRRRSADAARGAQPACGVEEGAVTAHLLRLRLAALSRRRAAVAPRDPNVLVVAVQSGPNNLDPRVGLDAVSQNIHQVLFNGLMKIDEHLQGRARSRRASRQPGADGLRRDAAQRRALSRRPRAHVRGRRRTRSAASTIPRSSIRTSGAYRVSRSRSRRAIATRSSSR